MQFPEHYAGQFCCIAADPPWAFKTFTADSNDRAPPYATMPFEALRALPVRKLAAPEGCHLFLWCTGPMLPAAFATMHAWGFRYSGIAFTWVKLQRRRIDRLIYSEKDFHTGLGYTTRKNTELCLLARRGNAKRIAKDVRELIIAPVREHSRKPDESYARIRRYCLGPYLDLFGRETRPGWTTLGDEPAHFDSVDSEIKLIKKSNQEKGADLRPTP